MCAGHWSLHSTVRSDCGQSLREKLNPLHKVDEFVGDGSLAFTNEVKLDGLTAYIPVPVLGPGPVWSPLVKVPS